MTPRNIHFGLHYGMSDKTLRRRILERFMPIPQYNQFVIEKVELSMVPSPYWEPESSKGDDQKLTSYKLYETYGRRATEFRSSIQECLDFIINEAKVFRFNLEIK